MCYYPEPTCFGCMCDHYQGVLLQEYNKYKNNCTKIYLFYKLRIIFVILL